MLATLQPLSRVERYSRYVCIYTYIYICMYDIHVQTMHGGRCKSNLPKSAQARFGHRSIWHALHSFRGVAHPPSAAFCEPFSMSFAEIPSHP